MNTYKFKDYSKFLCVICLRDGWLVAGLIIYSRKTIRMQNKINTET